MTKATELEALSTARAFRCVAIVRFTSELSRWDPETFVRTVLVEWLRASEVWVGANFLFGHGRTGNFTVLRTLGQHYGFRAEKIDPVSYKDFVVSSTRIRRLIRGALTRRVPCLATTITSMALLSRGSDAARLFLPPIFRPRMS